MAPGQVPDLFSAARYSDTLIAMNDGRIVSRGRLHDTVDEALVKKLYDLEADIVRAPGDASPLSFRGHAAESPSLILPCPLQPTAERCGPGRTALAADRAVTAGLLDRRPYCRRSNGRDVPARGAAVKAGDMGADGFDDQFAVLSESTMTESSPGPSG
ncbi:hypothetical protein AB0942_34325 [Streptomyces nodosus]|uniref:hypothetical protein n=1 Tax=Streptomyces nodosus TaxID=40318 RepID=UPI003456BBF7